MIQGEKRLACFQFSNASLHLAASFESLHTLEDDYKSSVYALWGSASVYASKMSKGLEEDWYYPWMRKKLTKDIMHEFPSIKVLHSRSITSDFSQANNVVYKSLLDQIAQIKSLEDLSKIEAGGIRPGPALVNCYVTETSNKQISIQKDSRIINLFLKAYLEIYANSQKVLKHFDVDAALVYNGRFLRERAVWDACNAFGIDTFLFETTRDRFHLRKNVGFHDRRLNQKIMKDFWSENAKTLDSTMMIDLGERYFHELESKKNVHLTYTPPSNLKEPYFVYFSNSDDEAIGFWEHWEQSFTSQIHFLLKLQDFFEQNSDFHLYIRLHPNLSNKSADEKNLWKVLLDKKNSTIIDPNDTLSSYILLKKATGVLSYGSTIGLEAAFNKIPSAVLADCWYDELGAVDRLSTFDEVISWMKTISAGMSEKELHDRYLRALIRGFWLERGGRNFTHSNLIELSWGAWKAQNSGLIRLDFRKVFVIISMLINRLKRRLGGLKN